MDAVSEIKSRLNIEDVVSEYVQLKRSGRNFKGMSPFSHEKSPSFMVSPEKQIWHDFSSGKGGDIFSFIQEVEGLDFKGALELLARKAGVELEEFKPSSIQQNTSQTKQRLHAAIETAVTFYQVQLTKNIPALKYLREKRGYSKQTLLDFRFGYSPTDGKSLLEHLISRGYSTEELQKAGLVTKGSGEFRDMFRGRIMIPLSDAQGQPVGFTARQLKDDPNAPKYINTPATILYDKGRQLFGFSQAKEVIRKTGYVVVVEGNLDVVASHQAGVKNVVASAGTALTTYHLKTIQRFTADVRLAFDEDVAGQAAAERTIPLAQAVGVELSIVSIPSGKDPDELIRENPELWQKTIENRQYMIDWLIERIAAENDLTSAQGKRQFTNKIIEIVKQLKDTVEQEHYTRLLAERTNTSFETVQAKLKTQTSNPKRLKNIKTADQDPSHIRDQRVLEQHLLAMSMKSDEIGKLLAKLPLDVFSEEAQETASFVQQHPGITPMSQTTDETSQNNTEYATMLKLLFEEYYQHTDDNELLYQAKMLLSRLVSTYAKLKKEALAGELAKADEDKQATLLKAVKQLDDLVVQFS